MFVVLAGAGAFPPAPSATGSASEAARAERKHEWMHALPSVENAASNGICRKLGFTLLEECEFEFSPGNMLRCNDWALSLAVG